MLLVIYVHCQIIIITQCSTTKRWGWGTTCTEECLAECYLSFTSTAKLLSLHSAARPRGGVGGLLVLRNALLNVTCHLRPLPNYYHYTVQHNKEVGLGDYL